MASSLLGTASPSLIRSVLKLSRSLFVSAMASEACVIFCESSLDRDWYPPRMSESFFSSLLPWIASFLSLSWMNCGS